MDARNIIQYPALMAAAASQPALIINNQAYQLLTYPKLNEYNIQLKPTTTYALIPQLPIIPQIQLQALPNQYALATTVPLQTTLPNVQYCYNVLSPESIFIQNISQSLPYNASTPTATFATLNPHVNHKTAELIQLADNSASNMNFIEITNESSSIQSDNDNAVNQMEEMTDANIARLQCTEVDDFSEGEIDVEGLDDEITEDECESDVESGQTGEIGKVKLGRWKRIPPTEPNDIDSIWQPRRIGPKCSSLYCRRSSKRQCYRFNEAIRNEIFEHFWNKLDWHRRQMYVFSLIDIRQVDQRINNTIRKNYSLKYFLRSDSKRWNVCKKLFLSTIGIGQCALKILIEKMYKGNNIKKHNINENSKSKETSSLTSLKRGDEKLECKPHRILFQTKQQESPEYWIREKVKKARERGEAYFGYCIKKFDDKTGRKSYGRTIREPRTLGPPCTSTFCERSTKRQCSRFTESIRKKIFDHFWKKLRWEQRKLFIFQAVDVMKPKRRTCVDVESSRRGVTCSYFLCINQERYNICRQLFLSTLGIKEATVQYWLMQNSQISEPLKNLNTNLAHDANVKANLPLPNSGDKNEANNSTECKKRYKSKRIRIVEKSIKTLMENSLDRIDVPNDINDFKVNETIEPSETEPDSTVAITPTKWNEENLKTIIDITDPFEDIQLRNDGNTSAFAEWEEIDLEKEIAISLINHY